MCIKYAKRYSKTFKVKSDLLLFGGFMDWSLPEIQVFSKNEWVSFEEIHLSSFTSQVHLVLQTDFFFLSTLSLYNCMHLTTVIITTYILQ